MKYIKIFENVNKIKNIINVLIKILIYFVVNINYLGFWIFFNTKWI